MRPHAVSAAGGGSYSYDDNGNMNSSAGRSVSYTPFNMTGAIAQGATSYIFTYDSEHNRVSQCVGSACTSTGTTTNTTWYINDPASGAMTEKFMVTGGTTTWRDYITAENRIVATRSSIVGGATTFSYTIGDELGSISAIAFDDTVSTLSGTPHIERDAYDPWGKRRNLNGTDDTSCALASSTTRGFTGHEMIDGACLINMNARIYDQTLGRFMSVDPVISDPYNSQALNAYSYVNNRPLNFTDPTEKYPLQDQIRQEMEERTILEECGTGISQERGLPGSPNKSCDATLRAMASHTNSR